MNILEQFNRCPPRLCRLLARKNRGRKAMSHLDIATTSGLSKTTVVKMSKMSSWNHVPLETIHRFSSACGVNPLSPGKQIDYMRRRDMAYILNAPPAQQKLLLGLLTQKSQAVSS